MEIGLNAAIVSIVAGSPHILTANQPEGIDRDGLPYGRFNPLVHRTMEEGLRRLAEEQTGLRPGYVEQLYTFGDRGRTPAHGEGPHVVSVGYLALTRTNEKAPMGDSAWRNWYDFFPWEDWRNGRPGQLDEVIIPALKSWADTPSRKPAIIRGLDPATRVRLAFGLEEGTWDDEQVLDRYELMYSAGLVEEAVADGRISQARAKRSLGVAMLHDHRRILATAIARLRKIGRAHV